MINHCNSCGHDWDYETSALFGDCPSCHSHIVTTRLSRFRLNLKLTPMIQGDLKVQYLSMTAFAKSIAEAKLAAVKVLNQLFWHVDDIDPEDHDTILKCRGSSFSVYQS